MSETQKASVASSKDKAEPRNVWTHPEHPQVCLVATIFKCTSFLLTGAVWQESSIMPFLNQKDEEIGLKDIMCDTNGYCMKEFDAKAFNVSDSGEVEKLTILILTAFAVDGVGFFLLLLFWIIYLVTGSVRNTFLRLMLFCIGIFAYVKFVAGWGLVSNHAMINRAYSWGTHEDDRMYTNKFAKLLKLQTLPASCLFFAFCFDIIGMCFLKVATDVGLPGMSHNKRIRRESKARHKQESIDEKLLGNRKSYAPDNQSEHKEHLKKIASTISAKELSVSASVSVSTKVAASTMSKINT